jgi:hypothetical protein
MHQIHQRAGEIFVAALTGAALMGVGCAGGLPMVITSTSDHVSIEFAMDSNLETPAKLAEEECQKSGKQANFIAVDSTATTTSRVANFECVDPPEVAGAATETPAAADVSSEAPAEDSSATPSEESAPAADEVAAPSAEGESAPSE